MEEQSDARGGCAVFGGTHWWWPIGRAAQFLWAVRSYRRGYAGDSRLMPIKAFGVASLFVGASATASGIHKGSVAEMVNKLCLGLVEVRSWYYNVAERLNAHYHNPINRLRATFRRVYFTDLRTGTATVAATALLLITLIQMVASVIQVLQNERNNASPESPPPPPFFG